MGKMLDFRNGYIASVQIHRDNQLEMLPLKAAIATPPSNGWGFCSRTALRFFFLYFLFYSAPLLLQFPVSLAQMIAAQIMPQTITPDSEFTQALKYFSYPET